MQFSLPHFLIFTQTGLHSQRQPDTSLLAQLVIDEVEPVKNKRINWQLIFKEESFKNNNLTLRSYLPGHYINIFSESKNLGKCGKLLHTLYLNKQDFSNFHTFPISNITSKLRSPPYLLSHACTHFNTK